MLSYKHDWCRALPWMPMPGCVFEHYGRIPPTVYAAPKAFKSPLEAAVFNNDLTSFCSLAKVRNYMLLFVIICRYFCHGTRAGRVGGRAETLFVSTG